MAHETLTAVKPMTGETARDTSGELYRHVVLPAGNLQTAIDQHLDQNGSGLDLTTLYLLSATRDILGDISRKGVDLATGETNRPALCSRTDSAARWAHPLFSER